MKNEIHTSMINLHLKVQGRIKTEKSKTAQTISEEKANKIFIEALQYFDEELCLIIDKAMNLK